MAESGDQRERHGVRDVGADDAAGGELRVEKAQGGDTQRTGADGGNRHQHADDGADEDGQCACMAVRKGGAELRS